MHQLRDLEQGVDKQSANAKEMLKTGIVVMILCVCYCHLWLLRLLLNCSQEFKAMNGLEE